MLISSSWSNFKLNNFFFLCLNPLLFNWGKSYFTPLQQRLIKHVCSCPHYYTMQYNMILRFLKVHKLLIFLKKKKKDFKFRLLAFFPAITFWIFIVLVIYVYGASWLGNIIYYDFFLYSKVVSFLKLYDSKFQYFLYFIWFSLECFLGLS